MLPWNCQGIKRASKSYENWLLVPKDVNQLRVYKLLVLKEMYNE